MSAAFSSPEMPSCGHGREESCREKKTTQIHSVVTEK